LAQEYEWNHQGSVDWHLRDDPGHAGVLSLIRELNRFYREEPALWERDFDPSGFRWLEVNDASANTIAYARFSADGSRTLVCVGNFSPVPRPGYRVGLPRGGTWREVLNTDAAVYGGSGVVNAGPLQAEELGWHGVSHSVELTLPPLGVVWLAPA